MVRAKYFPNLVRVGKAIMAGDEGVRGAGKRNLVQG